MAHGKRSKINIPIVLACILLCLTLISIHFTSGLYARYVSTADGKDSAKVASFGNLTLEEEGSFQNSIKTALIIPGVDLEKNAMVSFTKSEVAAYVIIEADLSNDWKTEDNRTFSVKNGEKTQLQWSVADNWKFIKKEGSRYAYYILLEPGEFLDKEPVVRAVKDSNGDKINNGTIIVSEEITRGEIGKLTGIHINFKAYAIQAGNMEPEDAWNKVKNS